jgi:polyvinyl alcohol dehydrogenase (cytochrome)
MTGAHILRFTISALFLLALVSPTAAQTPPASSGPGQAVFDRQCAACHAVANASAPTREALRALTPEAIVNALTNGKMAVQGSALSEADRRAVAEFLTGRSIASAPTPAAAVCTAKNSMGDPTRGPRWNGWGNGVANARYQPKDTGGLTAADLPKLKLKWAFGYQGVSAARAQPTFAGGRLFVASENGEVHALDPKTGCTYWTFKAQAGVRTALSVAPYKSAGKGGYAVYFGDSKANVYAVDANTGTQIWTRKADEHRSAAITGAPTVYDGKVFVPVQGLNEEGQGGRGGYECCTFRGNVTTLDANTGALLWKRYTVGENKPRGKNAQGVQTYGPAGGGIWSSPTVDTKRRMVYVATGNGYADPPQPTTDAVLALDIDSGAVKWVRQVTPNDQWTMGCQAKNPDKPECPDTLGPDFDFSASPALTRVNNRDLIVLPQKSGMAWALDPDNEGNVVWQYRIGQGSGLGGQWGAATDGQTMFVGTNDFLTPKPGGMNAIRLSDGKLLWRVDAQPKLCGENVRGCNAAQGGAVTAIPGAALQGALDGGLRAYAAADGRIIWQFDTNREFATVNGVKANGGGMDGPGPIVAGGMLFVNSGYGGLVGRPGTVLLAFGLD